MPMVVKLQNARDPLSFEVQGILATTTIAHGLAEQTDNTYISHNDLISFLGKERQSLSPVKSGTKYINKHPDVMAPKRHAATANCLQKTIYEVRRTLIPAATSPSPCMRRVQQRDDLACNRWLCPIVERTVQIVSGMDHAKTIRHDREIHPSPHSTTC